MTKISQPGVGSWCRKYGNCSTKIAFKKIAKINSDDVTTLGTFVVKKEAKDDQGLSFVKGDRFNVLEIDDDSVLIEKIGDSENPYFVSGEFLESISDFRKK